MTAPLSQEVVFGGGIAAPMAALAVARAFGRLGVEVAWIEHGSPPSPDAALMAPPDLATFHRLLGISEALLVTQAAATLNMGQQFAGWSGGDGAFLNAYGDAGSPYASLPFVQHWSRARRAGLGIALEDFSLAAAAAKQGRTGHIARGASGQTVKHGYHLDARAYAALLRAACLTAGVRIMSHEGARPAMRGEALAGIALPDGSMVEANLFIDANGMLIDAVDPHGAVQADRFADRVIRASAPAMSPLPLFSRVTAHEAGWLTLLPLSDRTAVEFTYSSAFMNDEDARRTLGRLLGRSISADLPSTSLQAKSRPKPWVGNCVAVGQAAMDAPLLDGAEALLLQLGIAQLVLLWPLSVDAMPEAAIYNEEMAGTQARLTDFTAQHFRLGRRAGTFWDAVREKPVSDALQAKIALFEARSMIAHLNHEAHVDDSWAFCLTGHGLLPRSSDPQAEAVAEASLMTEVRRQLGAIAADVRAMPTHAEALATIGKGA